MKSVGLSTDFRDRIVQKKKKKKNICSTEGPTSTVASIIIKEVWHLQDTSCWCLGGRVREVSKNLNITLTEFQHCSVERDVIGSRNRETRQGWRKKECSKVQASLMTAHSNALWSTELGKKFIFQQDNDHEHTAKITKEWLQDQSMNVLQWQRAWLNICGEIWKCLLTDAPHPT